jgi:uncharacterized membrane protein
VVVHFAIALLVVGVVFRLISLTGRAAFTGPAALTLLLLGTGAAAIAVQSGDDAHGPAEHVPGARDMVKEHEEWGERTRNVFFLVVAFELLALILRKRRPSRPLHIASAVVGLGGLFCLYEAGEHGGDLVYSYAGGVGVRSGDPEDVGRLLLAGIYHQAQLERTQGHSEEAVKLFAEMARRFPESPSVQLLAAESLLEDRQDAAAALAALEGITIPQDNRRLVYRSGLFLADALQAAGERESAEKTLEALLTDFPDNRRILERLEKIREQ